MKSRNNINSRSVEEYIKNLVDSEYNGATGNSNKYKNAYEKNLRNTIRNSLRNSNKNSTRRNNNNNRKSYSPRKVRR
jgi:hypothetical protein